MTETTVRKKVSLFRGRKGWSFGGVGGGAVGGVGGVGICGYYLQIFTRKVNILPFVNAKMLWMPSPKCTKHVQVICIINFIMDYYFNT